MTASAGDVLALIGLTVSGMGISYLPRKCLAPMIDSGALEVLTVTPALPPATFAAICKVDQRSSMVPSIAMLAQHHCDFGKVFQTQ